MARMGYQVNQPNNRISSSLLSLMSFATGWTYRSAEKTIGRFGRAVYVGGKTTVKELKKNRGIRASIDSAKLYLAAGKVEEYQDHLLEVQNYADEIIRYLKLRKVVARRIAIDGVPGSGKSTLSRVLAKKLRFEWKTLDYIDMNKQQDFTDEFAIYEHHRLLRTQNIENFDVIIYIDEPVDLSKERCIHRKRGGVNIDIFDYEKLKKIGEKAFEISKGDIFEVPNSYLKIKIRPRDGYSAYKGLCYECEEKGFSSIGFAKEELLFFLIYGKPKKGLNAYINFGAYNKELTKGIEAGVETFFSAK